ncbi:hypothetical protein GCM10011399_08400 [Subtercola lobariae]|uniref:Uncharacterized protein n=1 Tax=Subtercola lobariae TaxID=1588641 RepID=A0A917EUQ1_9MICO|nr:hypothetical protein GCM10011399_08400 [Subtercola lobariae]
MLAGVDDPAQAVSASAEAAMMAAAAMRRLLFTELSSWMTVRPFALCTANDSDAPGCDHLMLAFAGNRRGL